MNGPTIRYAHEQAREQHQRAVKNEITGLYIHHQRGEISLSISARSIPRRHAISLGAKHSHIKAIAFERVSPFDDAGAHMEF
jgi:hypothetical protein